MPGFPIFYCPFSILHWITHAFIVLLLLAFFNLINYTAFNIFANAFVRAKGMPFAVTIQESDSFVSKEAILADTDQLLADFASDYRGMAE